MYSEKTKNPKTYSQKKKKKEKKWGISEWWCCLGNDSLEFIKALMLQI